MANTVNVICYKYESKLCHIWHKGDRKCWFWPYFMPQYISVFIQFGLNWSTSRFILWRDNQQSALGTQNIFYLDVTLYKQKNTCANIRHGPQDIMGKRVKKGVKCINSRERGVTKWHVETNARWNTFCGGLDRIGEADAWNIHIDKEIYWKRSRVLELTRWIIIEKL